MPPQARGPQSGPTAEDQSDTGPDTVTTAETGPQPVPTAEARSTGGPKLIRTLHPGDRFIHDPKAHEGDESAGVVTGAYQEFPATQAKDVIAAAASNGVTLLVADKES
jgi:hypothetical protein